MALFSAFLMQCTPIECSAMPMAKAQTKKADGHASNRPVHRLSAQLRPNEINSLSQILPCALVLLCGLDLQ